MWNTLPNGETFTFWQYSHRGMSDGYNGDEIFIDMNLYNGTYAEFIDEFLNKKSKSCLYGGFCVIGLF